MQLMNMIWCLRTLPLGCSIIDHWGYGTYKDGKEKKQENIDICNLYVIPKSSLQYRHCVLLDLGSSIRWKYNSCRTKKNRE